MMRMILDIETVKHENADTWWLTKEVKAPSNYKDEEKIKRYIEDARKKLGSKSALTWHTARMFSFSYSFTDSDEIFFAFDLDEAKLLSKLHDISKHHTIYTKGGKGFDFPFLIGRYMAHSLPMPMFLKNSSSRHDVDEFFSYSMACDQRGSLDMYAFGLGIEPKKGTFQIVEEVYADMLIGNNDDEAKERLAKLEEYNKHDVYIVKEMLRRYELIN